MTDETDRKRDLSTGVERMELDARQLIAGVVGEDEVLLVKGTREVFAIAATCTHSGAPLARGVVVGDTVRCPWHHACFDASSGAAVAAPALKALRRWTVEEREGRLFVASPKPENVPVRRGTDERIVIVGAGAAGLAAADALARMGASALLIGCEDEIAYDRTALSKHYLAGTLDDDKLGLELDSLSSRGIDVRLSTTVVDIDPAARLIRFGDGSQAPFSKLILATGGEPKRLQVAGADLPHVHTLRSAADARRIVDRLAVVRRAVVVGGSFIGFESAAALRDRGVEVTVVAPNPHPFRRTLGPALSDAILAVHRRNGTQTRLGSDVARIESHAVTLSDGTFLPADLVLVGIGVTPRTGLAERAGLRVDDGLIVDQYLETSHPGIYAAGDIARWPDPHCGKSIRVEHWAVAQRQGQVAALNALGTGRAYDVVPFFWTMHFDFSVRVVGHAGPDAETFVDGNISERNATIRFREAGRDMAVATVDRDLACLHAELVMERQLGGPAAHLPPPT